MRRRRNFPETVKFWDKPEALIIRLVNGRHPDPVLSSDAQYAATLGSKSRSPDGWFGTDRVRVMSVPLFGNILISATRVRGNDPPTCLRRKPARAGSF